MFEGSESVYDAIYSFKDYVGEADRVHDRIVAALGGRDGKTLLDVACGTGMHLIEFKRYYDCQGLDLNEKFVEIARNRTGVAIHQGPMESFDLAQTWDIVTCLFSSIGYVGTLSRLNQAIANMAKHVSPGGVLVVEPWLAPEMFIDGHLGGAFVDTRDLKVARMHRSKRDGQTSVIEFHYLIGNDHGIRSLVERHTMGLFTDEQYQKAFTQNGLRVEYDPEGPMGRGLYLGIKS